MRVQDSSALSSSGGDPLHQHLRERLEAWREMIDMLSLAPFASGDYLSGVRLGMSRCANDLEAALQRSQDLHGQEDRPHAERT